MAASAVVQLHRHNRSFRLQARRRALRRQIARVDGVGFVMKKTNALTRLRPALASSSCHASPGVDAFVVLDSGAARGEQRRSPRSTSASSRCE